MMNDVEELSEHADKLIAIIKPILAGNDSEVVCWTLAELTAINVAGHIVQSNGVRQQKETDELRSQMLTIFMTAVRQMIPLIDSSPDFQEFEERELQKQRATQ